MFRNIRTVEGDIFFFYLSLSEKKVCAAVFLDVAQAFDKSLAYGGLLVKLHEYLPEQFFEILRSYIEDRHLRVRHGCEHANLKKNTSWSATGKRPGADTRSSLH